MYSIRLRLLWALSALVVAGGCCTVALTFFTSRGEIDTFLDLELQQTARSFELISLSGLKNTRGIEGRLIVQVTDRNTGENKTSHKIRPFAVPDRTGFYDVQNEGASWRIYALLSEDRAVITAQPVKERMRLAFIAALHIIQPVSLLLPLLVLAVWVIIGKGLSPLGRVARAVQNRSEHSLEPLDALGLPEEVAGLVNALNGLLRRLETSLNAQRQFANDAAHELRTPLTALKLQAQLVRRAATPEERDKLLGRLDAGIDRASHLVAQLLAIARLDPQAVQEPFKETDLYSLCQQVKESLDPLAQEKHISIELSGSHCLVSGLSGALFQMASNLVDNAIRYAPENSRIRISAEPVASGVRLTVSDNGPGIRAEDRKRVFDRFYRALGTKTQGNGLGLAIVARIAEIHKADIQIGDGLDGRGVSFVITFPAVEAPPVTKK